MAILQIHLLGSCRLTFDGQPLTTVNQPRVQALLAWLLLHRQAPQPRGHLAFTFWPDVSEAHARNNLRQLLHQLRHALPPGAEYVRTDATSVQWSPNAPCWFDVAAFAAAAAEAAKAARSADKAETLRHLQAALDLYAGDLLPGCYDDWIAPEREHLRRQAHQVCGQIVELLEERRDYRTAIAAGRRQLQIEPLEEATYAALMRLHALNGDRAAALRVYHDCATILQRELEVEPGAEVQAVYRRLLQHGAAPGESAPPSSPAGAIPLVGRAAAWDQVRAAWQASVRGQPALLLITGEAGIGKTRLAEELLGWADRQGIAAARAHAYAAEGRLAYAPVAEWLRDRALAPSLARLEGPGRSEAARLLPELLHQQPALAPPAPLAEGWQRQHFFTALARATLTAGAPLLLLLDDMQWCDEETLEWLHFLLRFDSQAQLLVVGTARSEEMAANGSLVALVRALQRAHQLHEVALGPLGAAEVADLAARVSRRPLAGAEAQQVFRESEGVPLFVVEMVRAGLGSEGRQPGAWPAFAPAVAQSAAGPASLPPAVYAVIAGRLAWLSRNARELAGVAATIGRAFTFDVLRRAAGQDEEAVIAALEELWQRRIVREQGADSYDFSHAKLRDVAYGEMSPMQRRRLHRRVAEALLAAHATAPDAVSGQVAAHYEQAGLAADAIRHYQEAAHAARQLLAHAEAIGHLRRALALLATLSPTAERERQCLALLLTLGTLLAAVKGNADDEVRAVYTEALALCRRVGDGGQAFVVQQELRICYGQRGEVASARPLAQENLTLAATLADPELLRYAHLGAGVICHAQGELADALAHFEHAIGQAAAPAGALDPLFFDNALQGSLRHSALTLWLLGCPDQAQARMAEALAQGRQQAQSIRYGMTLYFAAMLHHYCGDVAGVARRAQELQALVAAQGYAFHQVSGPLFAGWALARQGQPGQGIPLLQDALAVRKASNHRLFLPYELGLLAEAHLFAGEHVAGLAAVAEALAVAAETGECVWQAELLRLRAELLRAGDAPAGEVAAGYTQALDLARRQGAASLQLRAATSLARLWLATGKDRAAHDLLAPLYAAFTEGLDTPDLQVVHTLLLGRSPHDLV